MSGVKGIAVVTGGGGGIGRAAALALARDGWHVVVAGRTLASLHETLRLGQGSAGSLAAHVLDVTEESSVDEFFAMLQSRHGRLDLLFNNAGVSIAGNVGDLAVADWHRTIATNLTGAFLCARGAFRLMRAQQPQGGRIINNGSISAYAPRPASVAYTATKHAITGLTKSISLDGRPFSIVCSQIDIGNARTDMAAAMATGVPQADGRIAVEPMIDLASVARAVVFMASLPLEENVHDMVIMASAMPFVGRG